MKPQNSRSLWAKLADQWDLLDEVDPGGDLQSNAEKLAKIDRAIKLADSMTKVLDTEIKLGLAHIAHETFEENFRNPQLKEYKGIELSE